jgi:hypothetical protein
VLKEPQREKLRAHKGKQESYNEETQVFEAPALAKLGQSGSAAIPVKKCQATCMTRALTLLLAARTRRNSKIKQKREGVYGKAPLYLQGYSFLAAQALSRSDRAIT